MEFEFERAIQIQIQTLSLLKPPWAETQHVHSPPAHENTASLSGIDPLGTTRKIPVRKKKSDFY
jgi:hypothetical protein